MVGQDIGGTHSVSWNPPCKRSMGAISVPTCARTRQLESFLKSHSIVNFLVLPAMKQQKTVFCLVCFEEKNFGHAEKEKKQFVQCADPEEKPWEVWKTQGRELPPANRFFLALLGFFQFYSWRHHTFLGPAPLWGSSACSGTAGHCCGQKRE